MEIEIKTTKGDKRDTIDSLVEFLRNAKQFGATHYKMRWSNDPMWAFKWFETYRIKDDEELKQDKINSLEKELKELKQ